LARATSGIPSGAVVSGLGGATAILAERAGVYLWPYPFRDSPAAILPPPLGPRADPAIAATVEYVVIPATDEWMLPAGFVEVLRTERFVQLRRAGIPAGG
jgi:hypothetical protein